MNGFKWLVAATLAANWPARRRESRSIDQAAARPPCDWGHGLRRLRSGGRRFPRGIAWYAALGVGTAALTIATGAIAVATDQPRQVRSAAVIAGALSLLHSFATSRAAPVMLSLRRADDDDQSTGRRLDRFERWQTARVLGQVATLVAMVVATGDR